MTTESPLLGQRRPSCPTDAGQPTGTCGVCPWRTDSRIGRFPPERYIAMASTSIAGWGPLFDCHTSNETAGHACVGWLLRDGGRYNHQAHWGLAAGRWNLNALHSASTLYDSYGAMALANNVAPHIVDALGVASPTRTHPIQIIPPPRCPPPTPSTTPIGWSWPASPASARRKHHTRPGLFRRPRQHPPPARRSVTGTTEHTRPVSGNKTGTATQCRPAPPRGQTR